jgi:hypothetical protein
VSDSTPRGAYPSVPYQSDHTLLLRKICEWIERTNRAKFNCTVDLTLTANAASTTLTDARIGYWSAIIPAMALTANAAAELAAGSLYIPQATILKGSAVVQHRNNAQTDRLIRFAIFG